MDRLKLAKELREEAQRLEAEEARLLPEKWELGMSVRFLHHKEWAWNAGNEATVVELHDNCKNRNGHEYQVFWTEPDGGGAIWCTTPDDVELVPSNGGGTRHE
jgi:hypothetical protein